MEKYRVLRTLSESFHARVSLAEALAMPSRSLVVLKEVSNGNGTGKENFQNESRILAALSHPNIVRLLDAFTNPPCLVTEYCEGGDLSQTTNLSIGEIQEIIIQLLLALKYLHDKDVIHRDLKIKNIFIASRSGGVIRIKIGDFGIARKLDNSAQMATTCVGTPFYLSPEVCAKRPYDKSVDIWSLGCVIYELLDHKRRHPFNAQNLQDLLGRIQEDPVDYTDIKDCRMVVMLKRMLCKDPRDRLDIDGLLQLPLIQEFIQEFVTKINNLNSRQTPPPLHNFTSLTPQTTDPRASLSNTAELLTTIQSVIFQRLDIKSEEEIEFKTQLKQAADCCRFVLNRQMDAQLEGEIEKVKERLSELLILPSRIQLFLRAVISGDYKIFLDLTSEMRNGPDILKSGLIGDSLVMLEIEKNLKKKRQSPGR